MSDLPPDPPRLRAILDHLDKQIADTDTIGIYLRIQRDAVRQALTAVERQAGRQQQPRRAALPAPTPQPDGYKLEKELRKNHPLGAAIHRADCTMNQRDTQPISANHAREALTKDGKFFRPCEFCAPDKALGLKAGA